MLVLVFVLAFAMGNSCGDDGKNGATGATGPTGPSGPAGSSDPVTAVEACVGCHGANGVVQVGAIQDSFDAHFVDTDPAGPLTPSGYRQLNVDITGVDVTGTSVVIDFDVTDESGADVVDVFAADGRFTIATLMPGAQAGDATDWESLITRVEDPGTVGDGPGTPATQADSERFSNGTFLYLGGASYRYTSSFDPSADVMDGDTMRVAIQLSQSDLPAGNGWCDFDADTSSPNDCISPVSLTRDIVQTATCNGCHGATSDTRLALHGGGRTEVEYCVTCHNPGTTDANSGNVVDFKMMIHKIHYGSSLANGYRIWGFRDTLHDYSTVNFTKDIDDCANCHTGGGVDVDNWNTVPTREACGSCHDTVNFDTGENHGTGGVQLDNQNCSFCHPPSGVVPPPGQLPLPVQAVHMGAARRAEAATYRGGTNGFSIDNLSYNPSGRQLTVDFSVRKSGVPMMLETAPEWNAGGGASRFAIDIGWNTTDYTNEDSGSSPGLPAGVNALDVGGAVTALGGGLYRTVVALPSSATSGSVTVGLEGHPAADLDGDGTLSDRIAVKNAFASFDVVQRRSTTLARRDVVDMNKCNACHDAAGAGLSLHGNNRTGEDQVCVLCHNANATDINRRPAPPAMTADGKLEETIDFKRMIHRIHTGAESQDGLVVYGFGGSVNDFSHVEFIGNRANCETCHMPGTYSTEDALNGLPTTIDTGADRADPDDDLNISRTASACGGCHDDTVATDHMKLNGASFAALDADIGNHLSFAASAPASSGFVPLSQPALAPATLDEVEQPSTSTLAGSDVIDMDACIGCHDGAGAAPSLHADTRASEEPLCGVCHDANVAGPYTLEETIELERMIHEVHTDVELQDALFLYGSGESVSDFSHTQSLGDQAGCETCHLPGSYSTVETLNGASLDADAF
jgi:OmcA/MtrC family decaheme c-type cytochrome